MMDSIETYKVISTAVRAGSVLELLVGKSRAVPAVQVLIQSQMNRMMSMRAKFDQRKWPAVTEAQLR